MSDDTTIYRVVMNHEEQYSIWPAGREIPAGWRDVGKTGTKPDKAVIGPAGVVAVAEAVPVPVFAIGGVEPSNVAELVAAGVHRACVIRGLAAAPDPEAAARELKAALAA